MIGKHLRSQTIYLTLRRNRMSNEIIHLDDLVKAKNVIDKHLAKYLNKCKNELFLETGQDIDNFTVMTIARLLTMVTDPGYLG
jgi:hypothetical protein